MTCGFPSIVSASLNWLRHPVAQATLPRSADQLMLPMQGFSYWIRQPGMDKRPAVSQERPETPNRSQGNTPTVSPFDSPSVSARNSADDEVDYSRLMK